MKTMSKRAIHSYVAAAGCALALLAPAAPASASKQRTQTIPTDFCGGGCSDLWRVTCSDPSTGEITARVRKSDPAADTVYEVTTLGYKGASLKGRADRETSPGNGTFSAAASIARPGGVTGVTKALVLVAIGSGSAGSYDIEFACVNALTQSETGNPTLKRLQDDY